MAYNYPAESADIQARMMMLGFQPNHLMLIGAFITAYGLFETTLERALWALGERSIEGVRPFTETMNTEAQFNMLAAGNAKMSKKCNAILQMAAQAARDLNEYRNSLVHGYVLSFGPNTTPSFMKNPHWHGATGRKKSIGDAYIDEPIQDLVLVAAWNLFALVSQVEKAFSDPDAQRAIEAMKDDVKRAKSYAGEARHLRHLMNHEKC